MTATGEADIGIAITDQDATNPKTDFTYLNSETTWIRLDTRFPPMDDLRVREALNYAVDRKAMLGTVVNAEAIPASQLPVPGINGHDDDLQPTPYDPAKAKELLAEAKAAGVPVDAKIRFIARSAQFAQVDEFAQVLTSMFQDIGLNVELEMMERGRQNRFQAKPLPTDVGPNIMLIMSDNNLGDAAFSVFNVHSDGSQSTTSIPELDALINKAISETGEQRTKDLKEVFDVTLNKYAAMVPLFHMVGITRVSERLDWKPTIATNSQLDVKDIKFAKAN
jgi:peptide/nickel transport system substrate-binding protein